MSDSRLTNFLGLLKKYAAGFQEKYGLLKTDPVTIKFLANNDTVTFHYLETPNSDEPTPMPVGEYWCNGTAVRKCLSNNPAGSLTNTYLVISQWTQMFTTGIQLISEAIDTSGPIAPPPSPISQGSISINTGSAQKWLPAGLDGEALFSDSNVPDGLSWGSVITDTSTSELSNKTLTSPVVNGFLSGNAILDEDDLVSNSNRKLATQQSIKSYVDSVTAALTGGVFLSANPGWDASSGALPANTLKGEMFFVTIAGGSGISFSVGDMLISKQDNASTSDLNEWLILNTAPINPVLLRRDVDLLNEIDMISNSAAHVASQQSIKTYVDTEVAKIAGPGVELADTPEWDASTGNFPSNAFQGNLFFCTVGGTVAGATYQTGDSIVAKQDSAGVNNPADWVIISTSNPDLLLKTDVLDDPTMAADSHDHVPTQNSVKAFVEAQNRVFKIDRVFYIDSRETLLDALVCDEVVAYDGYITAVSARSRNAFDVGKTCTIELAKDGVKLPAVALNITLDNTTDVLTGQTPLQAHKTIGYETAGYQITAGKRVGLMVSTSGVDFPTRVAVAIYIKLDSAQ